MRDLLLVIFLLPFPVVAAETVPAEIVVTDTNLKRLRADLAEAEDAMYAIFNAHVDKEFRVICEDVAVTGSLIEQRMCEPNFRRQAKIRDFREAQDGGRDRLIGIRDSRTLDRDLADKDAQYNQLMTRLAEENQAFLDAAVSVLQLRRAIANQAN